MVKKGTNFTCPVCSKVFYRYPSQIVEGKPTTCSRTCAARYFRDKGEWVDCPNCSTPFWRTQWAANKGFGNYCSKRCWVDARKTPLGEVTTNSWKPWQVKEWKGDKCARCGSAENLELDHIVARSIGGQNVKENAQTLCKSCNIRKFQCEDLPAYLATKQRI